MTPEEPGTPPRTPPPPEQPPPAPWTPEAPGAPVPPAGESVDGLPPPPGHGAAAPPVSRGGGWLTRRLVTVLAIIAALVVVAVIGAAISSSHGSRLPLVSSQSSDGTFHSGDCVSLSATRVTKSDCGGAHDAQIIEVVHGNQACPAGTQEFDVNDGSGNLCLDPGNNSKG